MLYFARMVPLLVDICFQVIMCVYIQKLQKMYGTDKATLTSTSSSF